MKRYDFNILGGVNINYKIIFSLLTFILILSVSSVSAGITDNDSFNLEVNDEFADINEDITNLNSLNTVEENYLSDSVIESNENDLASFNSNDIAVDSQDNEIIADDEGDNDGSDVDDSGDDTSSDETPLKNTTLTIISQDNWKIYGEKNYTVTLLDEDSNPIENAKIKFNITYPNGKSSSKTSTTNEEGIATLNLNFNLRGNYLIEVSYDGNSEYNPAESVNSTVQFYEKTIIKTSRYGYRSTNLAIKLVTANGNPLANRKIIIFVDETKYTRTTDSKGQVNVKLPSDKKKIKLNCTFSSADFYEKSNRTMDLPVYKKTYTKPLIYVILKGQSFKVSLKGTDGKILKNEKLKITINGKTYTKTTNKKGIAYLKLNLKRNVYQVKLAYGNNSVYGPSTNTTYLEIIDRSGQFKKGLNQMTRLSVYKYLSGGGRAKVTKSIRTMAKKITRKYTTKLEKATAIFNYVRDTLGYDYYANSLRGASKTLKLKRGNCCDHSNLIVALCRAVKIPARYAHAQGCRFKLSGRVEGHVWAQIYVGGKWYSADGTSYKNSLGHVNNWDTRSYYRLHIYRSIPF